MTGHIDLSALKGYNSVEPTTWSMNQVSRIKTKRMLRTLIFYVCVGAVVTALYLSRSSITVGFVKLLNSLAETYNSLIGR